MPATRRAIAFVTIWTVAAFVACCVGGTGFARADDDLTVANFEGESYGEWTVEGEAFGSAPARGTLPGQMEVTGFEGKGLINSFVGGDRTTGTLTSPEFAIERDYLSFLIGGGGYAGETCIDLLHDGKVVRTATGPNTKPGGSEALDRQAWDVRDLEGKSVTLRIVDRATGGWGHINVDDIVQTDDKPAVLSRGSFRKELVVDGRYLLLPIENGTRKCDVVAEVDGQAVRRYEVELASDADSVDWYAFLTVEEFADRELTLSVTNGPEAGFDLLRIADEVPGQAAYYSEALRPQLRFSQKVGWINDPNGMVYQDGEWHLFFQHNPVGHEWGNMTWGHAVSEDLLHWKQLPDALFPKVDAVGDCFSGGAVIDETNTSGFGTGDRAPLVAFLTDTGAGESLAYSLDGGRDFTWYEGNPVVRHRGRDPKVIRYEPGDHWSMVVYDEDETLGQNLAFYTSKNLKDWEKQSHLPGYFECPELFELAVDGDPNDTRWVTFGADAQYALGDFDGKTFAPQHEGKHRLHHGAYYASQTFENAPRGRRIQIGWARIGLPGMPFNQAFSFPHELTLRTTPDGVRMFAEPIAEIERLRQKTHSASDVTLADDQRHEVSVGTELLDVVATFEVGNAKRFGLDFAGERVVYDVQAAKLNGADLTPVDGRVTIRVLVDRPMLEIGGNAGRVVVTSPRGKPGPFPAVRAFAEGGAAKLVEMQVHELESIWNE